MGAFSLVRLPSDQPAVFDLYSRKPLEQRPAQLESGSACIPIDPTERQIGRTALAAITRHQHRDRLTPRDGMGNVPMAAGGALVFDPQVTWL